MEYISNAESLAARLLRFSIKLPKRYQERLADPVFNHAEEVVYHCRAANKVYVCDQATFELRREHLIKAEGHLLHVETLLGVIHRLTLQLAAEGQANYPKSATYQDLADKIEYQRKLISGVKKYDKRAYNKKCEARVKEPADALASLV